MNKIWGGRYIKGIGDGGRGGGVDIYKGEAYIGRSSYNSFYKVSFS